MRQTTTFSIAAALKWTMIADHPARNQLVLRPRSSLPVGCGSVLNCRRKQAKAPSHTLTDLVDYQAVVDG
jgi:hypothetical protein